MAIGETHAEVDASLPIHLETKDAIETSINRYTAACEKFIEKAKATSHLPDIRLGLPNKAHNTLSILQIEYHTPGQVITANCPIVEYSLARNKTEFKPRKLGIITPDGLVFPLETIQEPVSIFHNDRRVSAVSVPINTEGEPQTGELIKGIKQNPYLSEGITVDASPHTLELSGVDSSTVKVKIESANLKDPHRIDQISKFLEETLEHGGSKKTYNPELAGIPMPPDESEFEEDFQPN